MARAGVEKCEGFYVYCIRTPVARFFDDLVNGELDDRPAYILHMHSAMVLWVKETNASRVSVS